MEERARERKAAYLAAHFRDRGITEEHVANMHPDVLAHHVKLAGINPPSPTTMNMVQAKLANIARMEAEYF